MEPGVSAAPKKFSSSAHSTMVALTQPFPTYRDLSHVTDDDKELNDLMDKADAEGVKGTDQTFPVKLHQLLSGSDEDGFSHIVSWQPHGRSFIVKKHTDFVEKVLPCCFRQSKFASFQRQLNLYGFRRITQGRDKGGYYHDHFLRGRFRLVLKMQRTKVKGTGARKASSPETEPDFYSMPFVHDAKSEKPIVTSPSAAMPAPAPASAAMSPLLASRAPTAVMTPVVPSPLQAARVARIELSAASLSRISPPSHPSAKQVTDSLLLGLTMPPASSRFSAGLPEGRRTSMAQMMLATGSRLQSLRDAPRLTGGSLTNSGVFPGTGIPSSSLLTGSSQQRGPLHLNALNMPCTCAIPAF